MSREYVLHGGRPSEVGSRIDYAAELNPQQLAAVTAPAGPALVLAGAGSGKTRTLTYRVAYLLEQGIAPERLLLLTFTNKAAREMMRRVSELAGADLSRLWGGTFHSIGARILRVNAEVLGYRADFTILDREDSEDLLKACIGAAGIDAKAGRFPKPEALADVLSRAVNERLPIARIVERRHRGLESVLTEIEKVAALYAERKRAANVVDFDDLLALWLRLLEEFPDVAERYRRRFTFVLVDEYQDTNQIQSDLIDRLAEGHGHVMVVGDDSQSIYSWRGANFRNILEFPRRYPQANIYRIEVNYRSTPEILSVANASIAANTRQFAKALTASRGSGLKPVLVPCEDGHQQAAFVAQRMLELHEEGVSLPEMAVLYRSHFHALELQLELTRRGIPFVITSGIRFFEQAHIKDVAAWLKLVANPSDELAFKRLVLALPGIGPKAAEKLWLAFARVRASAAATAAATAATAATDSASTSGTNPKSVPLATCLMGISAAVPKKAATAWAQVATTVSQIEGPEVTARPAEMIRLVVEAFYEDYAHEAFANPAARLDDLEQLAAYAGQFLSLTEFLTQLSLLNNLEAEVEQRSRKDDDDRVRLSTVHQAKGLEYQVVFVIMLCDGLFPSGRAFEDPEAVEEERRLFYVAVTRARDELYLCHPLVRLTPGQGMSLLSRSRFLSEIPTSLLDEWNLRPSTAFGGREEPAAPRSAGGDDGIDPDPGDEPF